MYTREVRCGMRGCESLAAYKIAAPWKIGSFWELKSYGLACAEHFGQAFRDAKQRAKAHPFSHEESVGEIGVYYYEKGLSDRQLERLKNLEENL